MRLEDVRLGMKVRTPVFVFDLGLYGELVPNGPVGTVVGVRGRLVAVDVDGDEQLFVPETLEPADVTSDEA